MQPQHYYYDRELVRGQLSDADWLSVTTHEGKFNTHNPVTTGDAAWELPRELLIKSNRQEIWFLQGEDNQ